MLNDSVPAHVLVRSRRIYSTSPDGAMLGAIAIRGDSIVAVARESNSLDSLITPTTCVIDDPTLTWLPAFYDTHNHLLEATRNAT
ncbi:MAG TPA: hypothetical protein VMS04_12840, partial [Vicinamibacterales bacterium]|nr:hypothetical protein [Vicinamibacterales bacterium]